jgi:hypothetical protein
MLATENTQIRRAFPNLKFHLEWQLPSRPAKSLFGWMCSLHIYTPVKVRTLHDILLSTLRKPQPNSGRPYVEFPPDSDVDDIVIHPSGSLLHSPGLSLDKCYRIRDSRTFWVHLEDGSWSDQPRLIS